MHLVARKILYVSKKNMELGFPGGFLFLKGVENIAVYYVILSVLMGSDIRSGKNMESVPKVFVDQ